MPNMYQGMKAQVTFGLSKDAQASALIGVGFLKKTRAVINFNDNSYLSLQAINVDLELTYETPTTRPPPTVRDNGGAYMSQTPVVLFGNEESCQVYAATAATQKEIKASSIKDGTKPIEVEQRPYRPKLESNYSEPEYFPDGGEGLEYLQGSHGKSVYKELKPLPQREDIIVFDKATHGKCLDESIQWKDCPQDLREPILNIIKAHWDVFDIEGLKKPVLGFKCQIDTGLVKPVCCKPPRYGPHETAIINKLVEALQQNDVIEDDQGPWGALIVLAAKPNQGHKHWSDYIWRLCVSYRLLNTVTRPFVYPSRRCDDAVQAIGHSRFYITMDLYWGYWQILMHPKSKEKTAFFVPGGKKHWKRMPMGALNSHSVFCAILDEVKREWNHIHENSKDSDAYINSFIQFEMKGEKDIQGSEIIVDDLFLHSTSIKGLLLYFQCLLKVCVRYSITVNLKKCRFFQKEAEFVGVDVTANGNQPASSKFDTVRAIARTPPKDTSELRKVIGFFGFYQNWFPWYEVRIGRWRDYIKRSCNHSDPEVLAREWSSADDKLLKELCDETISKPTLARPNYDRRFYVKSDWSRTGSGLVLCQADPNDEHALMAEQEEDRGGPCVFDKNSTATHFRLRPIGFYSWATAEKEQSWHSYQGKASVGVRRFQKLKQQLLGRTFTWMTDCSGLQRFFEGDDVATHVHQRWKQAMLRFNFTIVHRPERMMKEADMLSRYDTFANKLRDRDKAKEKETGEHFRVKSMFSLPAVPCHVWGLQERGPFGVGRPTALVNLCSSDRSIWDLGAAFSTTQSALELIGMDDGVAFQVEPDDGWNTKYDEKGSRPFFSLEGLEEVNLQDKWVDWIVISLRTSWTQEIINSFVQVISWETLNNNLNLKVIALAMAAKDLLKDFMNAVIEEVSHLWEWRMERLDATNDGSPIEADIKVAILARKDFEWGQFKLNTDSPGKILDGLDEPTKVRWGNWENIIQSPTSSTGVKLRSHSANLVGFVKPERHMTDDTELPVFGIHSPAPNLLRIDETSWGDSLFIISDDRAETTVRRKNTEEIFNLLGINRVKRRNINRGPIRDRPNDLLETIPSRCLAAIFQALTTAESGDNAKTLLSPVSGENEQVNQDDILSPLVHALPTIDGWRDATALDDDLAALMKAFETSAKERKFVDSDTTKRLDKDNISLHTLRFNDPRIKNMYEQGYFEVEDQIVYKYEHSTKAKIRQLRTMVVPRGLQHVVIAACHASPMSGHLNEKKTLWKIAARFWWSTMAKDVAHATKQCAHCRVSGIVSHEAQQVMKSVASNAPFDIMAFDVWKPGDLPTSIRAGKSITGVAVLTGIDVMTGFAVATVLRNETAEEVARCLFHHFIGCFGLMKMVIIDDGSEFKGILLPVLKGVGIDYHLVSKGNHKGVQVERFHRYMNKIQKIHAADCETKDDWIIGTTFGVYAWNSAPVEGTDVIRSFAAIGREFHFPIDSIADKAVENDNSNFGDSTMAHIDGTFPLLFKQWEI